MNAPNLPLARSCGVAVWGWSRLIGAWPHGLRLAVLVSVLMGIAHPMLAQIKPRNDRLENVDRRRGPRPALAEDEGKRGASRAEGLRRLREDLPEAEVEFDAVTGGPGFIRSKSGLLASAVGNASASNSLATVRAFLDRHQALYGHDAGILNSARVRREFVTPHNRIKTTIWEQELDGLPVCDAVLVAQVSAEGDLIALASRFVANAARAADPDAARRGRRVTASPVALEHAVVRAALDIGDPMEPADVRPIPEAANAPAGDGGVARSRRYRLSARQLPGEIHGHLTWLPISPTRLQLCWEIVLTGRTHREMFRVLVDAETGAIWMRHSLTAYTVPASYRVYTSDSPSPFSPGHSVPSTNQPPLRPRVVVTNVANTNASPADWIRAGGTDTRGNNVEAHTDTDDDDEPDLPRPDGGPGRVFDFPLDLSQPPSSYAAASVVQLFYWCNWMHDRLYELGFTEAAGNFQVNNFGRGGEDGDPVQADAQDGGGVNNANMATPPDGISPRMQMYLFNGPSPDRDGSLDAEVVVHEYTHGLSNRRVGGGVGLYRLQSVGMGEGWSDFYALALLSEAGDDVDGAYAAGGYLTYRLAGLLDNYYFGIRRYPYSTDLTRNPLTFKDIDPTQAIAHEGVPRSPLDGSFDAYFADEVHNQGEVWCSMLWEARANLIRKHGFAAGNRLILQLVTDGMNFSPPNPNFAQARDAILLADRVNHRGTNQLELWTAFAKRGLGASALAPVSSTTIGVREAFDPPDRLTVLPSAERQISRRLGEAFDLTAVTFSLSNAASDEIVWTARSETPWLRVLPASGTLAPRGFLVCTTVLDNAALALPPGTYLGSILFSNAATRVVQPRFLTVKVGGEFFTQSIDSSDSDLAFQSFTFTPDNARGGYAVCRTPATRFLTDPIGGTTLTLTDDAALEVRLANGAEVSLFGRRTNVFFVGSNGYLTTGTGDSNFIDITYYHFDRPRISAFFTDLNPALGGRVSWKQTGGLVAVTFQDVPERFGFATNSFQVEWFFDGRIRLTYLRMDSQFGVVGLSAGGGLPAQFDESDFSAYPDCRERPLRLDLPPVVAENAGAVQGVVALESPVLTNVTVSLRSSDPGEFAPPGSIVIPAGQSSATFVVDPGDDRELDGGQLVLVTASAPGFLSATAQLEVADDESTNLRIVPPESLAEGTVAKPGSIEIGRAADTTIVVSLLSSRTNELIVPATVFIPAGATSVVWSAQPIDDPRLDGPQDVTVTASVQDWSTASALIRVFDNESTNLVVFVPRQLREGTGLAAAAGRIRLDGTLPDDLRVALTSSDPRELTIPGEVVIPAGGQEAEFDLTVNDDAAIDGMQTITVTATAPNLGPGRGEVSVLDNESPWPAMYPQPPHRADKVSVATDLAWAGGEFDELVVNGGFEDGTFRGWVLVPGFLGNFSSFTATNRPVSGDELTTPWEGVYCAAAQQFGPGRHEVFQTLTLPPGSDELILRWADRVRNAAAAFDTAQEYRVEIRSTNNAVLAELHRTRPGDPLLGDWRTHQFDLSSLAGQTVRLAFVVNPGRYYLEVYLDGVSVARRRPNANTTFEVFFGQNPQPGPAEHLGTTTAFQWALPDLQPATTYYWQVNARTLGQTNGAVWQFTTAGVDHFDWEPIPSPQRSGQSIPVQLTARDERGEIVSNFTGQATLAGVGGVTRWPLFGDDFEDGDFNGWERVSDYGTWAVVTSTSAAGRRSLSLLGGRRGHRDGIIRTFPNITPDLLRFHVRALRVDALGGFVTVGTGTNLDQIAIYFSMGPEGMGIYEDILQGHRIPFRAGQWYQIELFLSWKNQTVDFFVDGVLRRPGIPFRRPLTRLSQIHLYNFDYTQSWWDDIEFVQTNRPLPIVVNPDRTGPFANGVWQGALSVTGAIPALQFRAEDGDGHVGLSGAFAVVADDRLSVSVASEPTPATLLSPIRYAVRVLNPGPHVASNLTVTNRFPAGVQVGNVQPSVGNCELVTGAVVCSLDSLAAGAEMNLAITVNATNYGRLTNSVIVRQASNVEGGPDEFYAAETVTTVEPPRLTVSDVTVTEGNVGRADAVFRFGLSGINPLPASVRFATADITATAGGDYIPAEGVLEFPPGMTQQTVVIPVLADTVREAREVFRLHLRSALNVTLDSGEALGAIIDDDQTTVATLPFQEGWETGLRSYWLVSGAGSYRAGIMASNQSHGGSYQFVMDNSRDDGTSARNELTLAVDLAGATNVLLRFWARGSSFDSPDGPPPSPFVGTADFDGVAVSMDGVRWYEVQSLRSVPSTYTAFTVALDEARIAHGLTFTRDFRIRFNRVSSYSWSFAGLAIDDISITGDRPSLRATAFVLAGEDCGVTNGAVDPGETVTALLWLTNAGTVPIQQLTATLLSTGNVAVAGEPQTYGVLLPGGPAVSRSFRFTAGGRCGDPLRPTLELAEAGVSIGRVQFEQTLGRTISNVWSGAVTTPILIPGNGPAAPYPSTLTVSLTGQVQNVTVTLHDFSHPLPDQVDLMLRGPSGRTVTLLSDTGGLLPVNHATLKFDQASTNQLPDNGQIVSGTYSPTNHGSPDAYPSPAPGPPYGASLAEFNGTAASGDWSLFVVDDTLQDGGSLGGWSLEVSTRAVECCGTLSNADVALAMSASPINATVMSPVTFSIALANRGPDPVVDLVLSNALPSGTTFISATSTVGTCRFDAGWLRCGFGDMGSNATASVAVTVRADQPGFLTNVASLHAATRDPAPFDNTARALAFAYAPVLSIQHVSASEDASVPAYVRFNLSLSSANSLASSVQFITVDQTAVGGIDYQPTNGVVTFLPGEITKAVFVRVLDDTLDETDETMALSLYNPQNLLLSTTRDVGTISDNDGAPGLSVSDVSLFEGDSDLIPALFRIQLTAPSAMVVTANFITFNGTALAATDYVSTNGSVALMPGETSRVLPVYVRGDRLNEAAETFSLSLSSPLNAVMLDPQAVATILNDDLLPTFSVQAGLLTAENCLPPNATIDPGEMVTVRFEFRNVSTGTARSTNLIATLQSGSGVRLAGTTSNSRSLGLITPGGSAAAEFALIADAACGGSITATFALRDGDGDLGLVTTPLRIGQPIVAGAENFDTAAVPSLPAGWTSVAAGAVSPWRTTSVARDTPPYSAFAANPGTSTTNDLVSPPMALTSFDAQVSFRHSFNTESNWDGGILELSIDGAPFVEWQTAGGRFLQGGYTGEIGFSDAAWTGSSGGFVTVQAAPPIAAVGRTIRLRWRFTSDSSLGAVGWYVDSFSVTDGSLCCGSVPPLLTEIQRDDVFVALQWTSVPGRVYRLQYKSRLEAEWNDLPGDIVAEGPLSARTDQPFPAEQRFYRVVLLP